MATINNIRGMLLEEAILYLLRVSGYTTIESDRNDETLENSPSGLNVKGRGGKHQIDAIADYVITPPFSHTNRFLLEAKCYKSKTVGIEVIRNAFGVLRDVEEYWFTVDSRAQPLRRHHYQYAVFSSSGYSINAQKYAFAHDIYLIPLADSHYIKQIIKSIYDIGAQNFNSKDENKIKISVSEARKEIREHLHKVEENNNLIGTLQFPQFMKYYARCAEVNGAILGMLQNRIPLFLVPNPTLDLNKLKDNQKIRIYYDADYWYLTDENEKLFSFDMPKHLIDNYSQDGEFSQDSAFRLKGEELNQIQAIISDRRGKDIKIINFLLDTDWVEQITTQRN